jgi:predicted dehydrogenase
MINIACIGNGNWGRNLVRTFDGLEAANLCRCCDKDEKKLKLMKTLYPNVKTSTEISEVLADKDIEAVAIASSSSTHYPIAKEALLSSKHVYVEKPIALNSGHARELIDIARAKDRKLMVGHLMEYHPGVKKLRELIDSGQLGDIYYIYCQRVNLGVVRTDENALWSFGPHDISIILHLLRQQPVDVSARGACYLQRGIQDVVFVNMRFKGGIVAHIQLSWLDPHKMRKTTIVGSKKMVVLDDMETSEKVKIYDKGVQVKSSYESYGEYLTLRFGDILIPKIDMTEPLKIECQHFLDCIKDNKTPQTDGENGLRVVRVLEAAQKSGEQDGIPVEI